MKSAISQALNGKVLCSLLLAPLCFLLGVALTSLYYSSSRPLSLLTSSGNFSNAPRKGLVTSSARSNSPASIECPRDWQGHLRVTSTPLDFQWLAVQEDSKDVKLVGPDGNGLDLKVLGTLTLLNNTVYKFDVTQSGSYELLVANERVSRFHLHPADCNCPGGFQEFLSQYQCPPRYGEEVRRSMARWLPHAITKEMMEYNGEHPGYHTHLAMLELAVFDNKLFCGVQNGQKCPPKPEDPLYFRTDKMIRLMHAVLRKVSLPDVIFFWSMEDNPMTQHYTMLPLYSSSSNLLFPTAYMIPHKFDGTDIIDSAKGKPWEEREDVAFFVGRMSGHSHIEVEGSHLLNPRMRGVEVAKRRPDLLDISVIIDNGQQLESPLAEKMFATGVLHRGVKKERTGDVKYVVDFPGNSAAWRLGCRFGDGAVTLKTQPPWTEYWHFLLEPNKNVVPVGDWADDLIEVVEAAKTRDAEMRCIAREAQLLSLTQMRQEDLICWAAVNLQHLATKLAFAPN